MTATENRTVPRPDPVIEALFLEQRQLQEQAAREAAERRLATHRATEVKEARETVYALALKYVVQRLRRGEIRPNTAGSFRHDLICFARAVGPDRPPNKVTRGQVEGWLEGWEVDPATKRKALSTVRGFWRWVMVEDYARHDPLASIRTPKVPDRVPRAIRLDQVTATLRECRDERVRLIVLLMVQEGLRACEVVALQVGDVDLYERTALLRGKGGHERIVPVSDETWGALQRYLAAHPARSGPLIRSYSRPRYPVTARHVGRLVAGLMKAAGTGATGHALRHTMASDMIDNGADIRQVQQALGHRSLQNTQIYLRRLDVRNLREAMAGRQYEHPRQPEREG